MLSPLAPALQVVLLLVAILSGAFDIRSRRIPNWLTVTGLMLGVGLNVFLYFGAGLRLAGLGFALAFTVYLLLYLLRAMGPGDVKLMAALGSIVGPGNWLVIFIFSALLGGITALVLVLFRGRLQKTLWNMGYILSEMIRLRAPYLTREELDVRSSKALRLPHGAVIAAAVLLFLACQLAVSSGG